MRALFAACLLIPTLLMGGISNTAVLDRMDQDLDFVYNTIQAEYGPFDWKVQHFGWDLASEVEKAKQSLRGTDAPSYDLYRRALKGLLLSMKDYHVSIQFYKTEGSFLPFRIAGVNGNYYISYFPGSTGKLSSVGALNVGDEVLEFDGKPIAQAIRELKASDFSGAVPVTDERMAQLYLTMRIGQSGFETPQGTVIVKARSAITGEVFEVPFAWQYRPEQISSPPLTALGLSEKREPWVRNCLSSRQMIYPGMSGLQAFALPQGDTLDYNELGARQSFIPDLGTKIWSSSATDTFYAYIFTTAAGKRIGYVRIPSYQASAQDAADFGKLIANFQSQTDGLVIDQVNNPGGSVFYLYALASYLTNRPLVLPKHHMRVTQAQASNAMSSVMGLQGLKTDADAQKLFGPSLDGYPVDLALAQQMTAYYQFLVDQWNTENLVTESFPLFGVDAVQPAAGIVYTKPILIAINSLDFSGGDFFPAIMQDNHRATLFGQRTAGAGGYVAELNYQNIFGVQAIHYTASLAERASLNPIENLGVKPDIQYMITKQDLQKGYVGYKKALLRAVDQMFIKKP